MDEQDKGLRATTREWRTAMIVLPAAALLTLGALAYPVLFGLAPATSDALDSGPAAQPPPPVATPTSERPDPQAGATICRTALADAENFGVLPAAAKPSGNGQPKPEGPRGRYACAADSDGVNYRIAVDLICERFDSQNCVALYSITDAKGAVLYRRQD